MVPEKPHEDVTIKVIIIIMFCFSVKLCPSWPN